MSEEAPLTEVVIDGPQKDRGLIGFSPKTSFGMDDQISNFDRTIELSRQFLEA